MPLNSRTRMKMKAKTAGPEPAPVRSVGLSPTEMRNPRSMLLDAMPLRSAIKLMLAEEARVPRQLQKHAPAIERAINLVVKAFRRGGRLIYAGAGTSGRLGVLDASECPPTFQTRPEMVQGVVAGGRKALWSSVEAAEDDPLQGAKEIEARKITSRDVVVGIAASGTTPFVWGALVQAKKLGATTLLVCFNPRLQIPRALRPALVIAVDVGPEVLTGSTRLKCGSATKLVLNLLTTLAMVRLGKVRSNLMVDVEASNSKLRQRAIRILRELTGADEELARAGLQQAGWNVRKAEQRLTARWRGAARADRNG